MSFLPRGTVYGVLLNFQDEYDALAPRMHDKPYVAPPRAPILYVKTANTWTPNGRDIVLPAHVPEVEIGATLGLVIGIDGDAPGFVLMNDLSVPHDSFYRPPIKFKCLDGFLGVGGEVLDAQQIEDPAQVRLEVRIDGELAHTVDFAGLRRDAATLLADVSEFMTLAPGDVLMLGCALGRPRARAGQQIDITASGFAPLRHTLVAEAA